MQELGCDLLMICSNVSPDSLGGIDRAAADLRASASGRKRAACASLSKRWPGGATSTIIAMPGRRSAARIIRPLGSFSTVSISSPARRISAPFAPSRATGSSSCRSLTRRCCRWTTSPGAGTSAIFRARAICRSSPSPRRWSRLATTARSRSRSSTTSSEPARHAGCRRWPSLVALPS